ncbi:MAG: hypothetical protein ABSF83_02035 [Nitrososphaerales archaeon]
MKGISSVYGFILIFLLSMASIQTWSSAVSALDGIQSAADQAHEVQQLQGLEQLSLTQSSGNLTIANVGQVPSTVQFLRLSAGNSSRIVDLGAALGVGETLHESVPPGDSVEAVTSLGNVFSVPEGSDPPGSVWSGTVGADPGSGARLYDDPYDASSLYLSSGSTVVALTPSGAVEWTFDAGVGTVTDVLPLVGGHVYVSVDYDAATNNAELYELDGSGAAVASYPVRLMASPGVSDSYVPPGDTETWGSQPVAKGVDSSYAFYDGWFYSSSGAVASIASDPALLAATDPSDFYLYSTIGVPYDDNACPTEGNSMQFASYTADSSPPGRIILNWSQDVWLGSCNRFPQQLISASTGGGVLAAIFSDPYFSESVVGTYYESYTGENPYLVVLSSSSGQILYQGDAPCAACTSVATDGTDVYLAVPVSDEIQVVHVATGSISSYRVGSPVSDLLMEDGDLFAISDSAVTVYTSSMALEKTIPLAPMSLASALDPQQAGGASPGPSFLVINSTSYAMLEESSSGRLAVVVGEYR